MCKVSVCKPPSSNTFQTWYIQQPSIIIWRFGESFFNSDTHTILGFAYTSKRSSSDKGKSLSCVRVLDLMLWEGLTSKKGCYFISFCSSLLCVPPCSTERSGCWREAAFMIARSYTNRMKIISIAAGRVVAVATHSQHAAPPQASQSRFHRRKKCDGTTAKQYV